MSDFQLAKTVHLNAGRRTPELSMIEDDVEIAAVLAAVTAGRKLADNGDARESVALIGELAPELQVALLAAPDVLLGLAHNGQAAQTLALIAKLTPSQRATVLCRAGTGL